MRQVAFSQSIKSSRKKQDNGSTQEEKKPSALSVVVQSVLDIGNLLFLDIPGAIVQAARNEPDIMEAVLSGAIPPDEVTGLLFAAESDELSTRTTSPISGGSKPLCSLIPNINEYIYQGNGNDQTNLPWVPWTYRLSETLPSSILPWIGAIEFGWRGFIDERKNVTAADSNTRFNRVLFRTVQESVGGFNLEYGLDLYLSNNAETKKLRQPLTEQDVMLATMITWNETSDDDYGAAAAMMYPWVVFNLIGVGNYNHAQVIGGPGATGVHDQSAHWNWFGVADEIISRNSNFDVRSWSITDSATRANYTAALTEAIPVAHHAMMDNSEYAALYENATLMAQLYNEGYPNPTNLATGIRHQPQVLISEQTRGSGADVSDLVSGFTHYQNLVQGIRGYPPNGISTIGYADPLNTIFHEPVQLIAPLPFIWAETSEGPYHLIGWEGSSNVQLVEQNLITPLCFEGNVYCPPDPPPPVDIP